MSSRFFIAGAALAGSLFASCASDSRTSAPVATAAEPTFSQRPMPSPPYEFALPQSPPRVERQLDGTLTLDWSGSCSESVARVAKWDEDTLHIAIDPGPCESLALVHLRERLTVPADVEPAGLVDAYIDYPPDEWQPPDVVGSVLDVPLSATP